ncbi:hypothetical protein EDC94DRAFT_643940 [Helicostylum pulchrum]|uniref:Uncharacterized protein n=1 Tax=Helicostylum pulchrum TaxID=562976 RepID=A0ABP9XJM5_9FUNG|nr:hypothetical protein EDC94DRAFT_643940 [Helicostylum pulchrum]
MLHPAVVAAFAFTGVVFVSWKIYEEYQERKMYEQYQRHRARYEQENSYEQQYNRFRRNNNEFDFDDNHEESTSNIRKRKPFSDTTSSTEKKKPVEVEEEQDQYELSDLESSIAERKRRLMAEQAFLDQEEENLRNRRNTIMRNSTEVIPLSNSRSIISNNISSSSSSDSDSEDDQHTSQNHIANSFDPFVDQFQDNSSSSDHTSVKYNEAEGSSTHEESNGDSTETIHVEKNQSQASINNSRELFYPSASLLSPSASAATSISGENITSPNINRSDSEESWDAVSEIEWNQSSANESDNEFSVASISEDDTRIRF